MTSLATAMVLAAGLGTRLKPLTERLPKPLVPVAGRTLLDHALDRLADSNVETAVVNLHHLGDMIADHLKDRKKPKIIHSRERKRQETDGGVRNALPHLGAGPFFVVNADVLWLNGPFDALTRLAHHWREADMDALLLLHETTVAFGYDGAGDFLADPAGRLARRPERELAPYLFTGVQILHPRLFRDCPEGPFSLNVLSTTGPWPRAGFTESSMTANGSMSARPRGSLKPRIS